MKATYLLLFGGTVSATNVDKQIIPAIYIYINRNKNIHRYVDKGQVEN